MLYVNTNGQTEFTDDDKLTTERYDSIYDANGSMDYTGLNYIRIFPEDSDNGLEVQADSDIQGGILKVLPKTLTDVKRLNNEEDGSIIISKENGGLSNKVSFTRPLKEYTKISREIKTSSLESVYIRISSKQKELSNTIDDNDESKARLLEYRRKLEAIQRVVANNSPNDKIEEKIVEAISKM